jgi:cytoskeletal protein CcmA (bactofilin family)
VFGSHTAIITPFRGDDMAQGNGLFTHRENRFFRSGPPAPQAPAAEPPQEREAAKPAVATPAPPAPKPGERKEARLVVGPDIKMKGVEVVDCDTLQVEGRIEATLDARVLNISEHGVFSGVVAVDVAEIHGRLEGELTVRKQLILHATGKVSGKVRYARIKVEEGAELSGDVGVLEKAPAGARPALSPYVPGAG